MREIIEQAQKNGWHPEAYFVRYENRKFFFNNLLVSHQSWRPSLNDVLFGTDFCEKYFEDSVCERCTEKGIAPHSTWKRFSWQSHQNAMLSMSEQKRIEFLEEHLEVSEEFKNSYSPGPRLFTSDYLNSLNKAQEDLQEKKEKDLTMLEVDDVVALKDGLKKSILAVLNRNGEKTLYALSMSSNSHCFGEIETAKGLQILVYEEKEKLAF